jgi:catalase
LQGIKNLTDQEAEAIIAKDRESHQRDLFNAIEKGDFPRWEFKIQVMTEDEANKYRINPFDLTKIWSHKEFPLIDVGVLELNKNPENYQNLHRTGFFILMSNIHNTKRFGCTCAN